MNNRLLQFLAAENINQSQFADSIGVARASISHILAGRNKPGYDFIENTMKRYPALNIEWLLTGRGRMYKTSDPNDSPSLFPAENTESQQLEPQVSSQNSPADAAVKAAMQHPAGRSISKIIVLYDDNSFLELI